MTPLSAAQIADAAGGTVVAGDAQAVAASVSTDSKTAPAGCVFVALRGDTHDGHKYLGDAALRGSTVALVDRDVAVPPGVAVVRVADTRRAMGRLATVVRRSVTRPKVVAVGGSNGKTSTKNTLHRVLSQTLRGSASPASFNNDVGVPATLFPVSPDDDYVIVEIGTNHPGEVEHLSRMCEPDVAVITSIGEEHLEFFGSLDAVRRENAAIVAGLRPGGLLVTCDDAGLLDAIAWDGPSVTFSTDARRQPMSPLPVLRGRVREGALPNREGSTPRSGPLPNSPPRVRGRGDQTRADDIHVTLDGTRFRVGDAEYALPAVGAHFATNALAVIAVAKHFGLADDAIRRGLATADASAMRMQRQQCGGVTVLNDAYNANPTSMLAAIDTLRQVEWPGRKIAVLGEMKELGKHAAEAHVRVAATAGAAGFDAVFAVGEAWRTSAASIGAAWFETGDAAADAVAGATAAGDLVLLKASRSVRLERVADALAARHA